MTKKENQRKVISTDSGRRELSEKLRGKNADRETMLLAALLLDRDGFLISEMRLKIMGLEARCRALTQKCDYLSAVRKDVTP